MKANVHLLAVLVGALAAANAHAQFVKGNEAVRVMPDGSRRVEIAPFPAAGPSLGKPCLANVGCHAGPLLMVETNDGLMECTEAYARPGSCRVSTYGSIKRSRLWLVKSGGKWLKCQYPDLRSKCVDMFAPAPANLPFDAVQ